MRGWTSYCLSFFALKWGFQSETISNRQNTGIFQLDNGYWGYHYVIKVNGQRKDSRHTVDELGKPFKAKASAKRARKQAILNEKIALSNPKPKVIKKTVTQVYNEYCEFGRAGKAYSTIKKQDSLWNNHIKAKFGKRYIDDVSMYL